MAPNPPDSKHPYSIFLLMIVLAGHFDQGISTIYATEKGEH